MTSDADDPKAGDAAASDPAATDAAPTDPDLAALIDAAPLGGALDAGARARIRRNLLQRIAADSTPRHLTVTAEQGDWQTFGPGVRIKVLHESGGVMSYLLALQAGAELPAHRHPIDEECMVIEGEVTIGELRFGVGSFHLGRQGVLHDRLCSDHGALIFLRGAAPELAHLL